MWLIVLPVNLIYICSSLKVLHLPAPQTWSPLEFSSVCQQTNILLLLIFYTELTFFTLKSISINPYLLTWKIWWAPNNASRWQMGFNSFEGSILLLCDYLYLSNYNELSNQPESGILRIINQTTLVLACTGGCYCTAQNSLCATPNCSPRIHVQTVYTTPIHRAKHR
jgi:hypothetical protein